MRAYKNITRVSSMFNAIIDALNHENIIHEVHIHAPGFAILAEGNDLGDMEIHTMSPAEVKNCDNEEIAGMCGYGWAICNDLEDIRDYARNYFWTESVLSGEHTSERV